MRPFLFAVFLLSFLFAHAVFVSGAVGGVDFFSRPLSAGKASLTENAYFVSETLGVANFSPELRFPVQLIYQHPEKAINPRWRLRKVLEESGRLDETMLGAFGIEPAWLDRFPRELSGGELQRFCVARALMSGCRYLICDEISTMLDVITQAQIWNVVLAEAEKRNMAVIAVTHNRHLAQRICTRTVDLSQE